LKGGDAQPKQIGSQLIDERSRDVAPAVVRVHPHHIEHGRRFDDPELTVVEAGEQEAYDVAIDFGGQRDSYAGVGKRLLDLQRQETIAASANGGCVNGRDRNDVVRLEIPDQHLIARRFVVFHASLRDSPNQLSAINAQDLSGDMPAQIAHEERGSAGHVIRLAEPPEHRLAEGPLADLP
jgi:hypothetical protein